MTETIRYQPYPGYKRPDERIIEAFHDLVRIINRTNPEARLWYYEAQPHPLTDDTWVQTGMFMSQVRRLEEYFPFLGDRGYFHYMRWQPQEANTSAKISIQTNRDSIWAQGAWTYGIQTFGFEGTRFDLEGPSRKVVVGRHSVGSKDILIEEVMNALGGAVN